MVKVAEGVVAVSMYRNLMYAGTMGHPEQRLKLVVVAVMTALLPPPALVVVLAVFPAPALNDITKRLVTLAAVICRKRPTVKYVVPPSGEVSRERSSFRVVPENVLLTFTTKAPSIRSDGNAWAVVVEVALAAVTVIGVMIHGPVKSGSAISHASLKHCDFELVHIGRIRCVSGSEGSRQTE